MERRTALERSSRASSISEPGLPGVNGVKGVSAGGDGERVPAVEGAGQSRVSHHPSVVPVTVHLQA